MARRDRGNTALAEPEDTTGTNSTPDEVDTSTTDSGADATTVEEASTSGTPATPTEKAELTDEQIAAAIEPFLTVVSEVVDTRNDSTGALEDEQIQKANQAYSALDGPKLKGAAKRAINDRMRDAMNNMDIVLARAYMELNEQLKASGSKKSGKAREPKAPVDPTEAFVERAAVLTLAARLVSQVVPEGVATDWGRQATEAVDAVDDSQVEAYRAWLLSEAEDKGDAPEASSLVTAAVKLSLGKSAKPGKAVKRSGGGGTSYDGPRRDIGKHITEAFASLNSGDFLKIAEIRKFESSEYGTDHPSAGAISARLFPGEGKPCTVEGVVPDTNADGDKGACKA